MDPGTDVARRIAGAYSALPEVEAVALGGSRAAGVAAPDSDVDLYVYAASPVPLPARAAVASGPRVEVGNLFFEPGDEWIDAATGVHVDAMFRELRWAEDEIDRVLVRCEARIGYSTAIWHNVRTCLPLFDRRGWLAALRLRADAPFPERLRRAIVERNRPLLAANLSSLLHQLERACTRGDPVGASHRAAAFLASLFDVLFAVNRVPHPGEKRLLSLTAALCPLRPARLDADVRALLLAAGAADPAAAGHAARLAASLDAILRAEGLLAGPGGEPHLE
ncbi:MAG TPA: nucleotidyltransferase domain-containing protein [Anaeromyxobacteraceae bacterium]|nr:nucleotidyltransferase domain-containing protein [Anaeromyxobacteraceae bacterium]